ncbi:unnamed protein product [Calypogeia fissa]
MDRDDMDERRRRLKAGDPPPDSRKDKGAIGWGATFVVLCIGAAIVGNILSLRRRLQMFHTYREGNSAKPGGNARQNTSSQQQGRPIFRRVDEAEARRIWAEHIRQMEMLRRRQEAFDRERMRYKRNYDSWQERHGDKWDWRWQGTRWEWQGESERVWQEESADDWRRASQRERQRGSRTGAETMRETSIQQHYIVLGLDPTRARPYTEAEIKAAFRAKALELHPDTNKTNKAEAEKKFLRVMEAYNALKKSK